MRRLRRLVWLALCAIVLIGIAAAANATPLDAFQIEFPFTYPGVGTFTQFHVGMDYDTGGTLTGVSLSSSNVDLSAFTSDPNFQQSAPIGVQPVQPAAPALVGMFLMPEMSTTTFVPDSSDPSTFFAEFGAGLFGVEALTSNPCVSATPCWLDATFTSAVLEITNGVPIAFAGDVTFGGPMFTDSGLVNPGSFGFSFLSLAPSIDPSHSYSTDATALGTLQATPVPEPASLTLLGLGMAGLVARRRRAARS